MSIVSDCFLKSPRFMYKYTGHIAATVDQSDGKVIKQAVHHIIIPHRK